MLKRNRLVPYLFLGSTPYLRVVAIDCSFAAQVVPGRGLVPAPRREPVRERQVADAPVGLEHPHHLAEHGAPVRDVLEHVRAVDDPGATVADRQGLPVTDDGRVRRPVVEAELGEIVFDDVAMRPRGLERLRGVARPAADVDRGHTGGIDVATDVPQRVAREVVVEGVRIRRLLPEQLEEVDAARDSLGRNVGGRRVRRHPSRLGVTNHSGLPRRAGVVVVDRGDCRAQERLQRGVPREPRGPGLGPSPHRLPPRAILGQRDPLPHERVIVGGQDAGHPVDDGIAHTGDVVGERGSRAQPRLDDREAPPLTFGRVQQQPGLGEQLGLARLADPSLDHDRGECRIRSNALPRCARDRARRRRGPVVRRSVVRLVPSGRAGGRSACSWPIDRGTGTAARRFAAGRCPAARPTHRGP